MLFAVFMVLSNLPGPHALATVGRTSPRAYNISANVQAAAHTVRVQSWDRASLLSHAVPGIRSVGDYERNDPGFRDGEKFSRS